MKVLVLGHKGMLGNAVSNYLSAQVDCQVLSINSRYPDAQFIADIKNANPDFVINCVGAIPQKRPSASEYRLLNEDLPKELDKFGIPVVHPSTDCEFDGSLPLGENYPKTHLRDTKDEYGQSKARISDWIERESKSTKIIRTSIIGHELATSYSLLDWFLSEKGTVNGYTDQYWNGITTLEWTKQCLQLMKDWNKVAKLTQLANPECLSKYELLKIFSKIYGKALEITPKVSGKQSNKCLMSDIPLSSIKEQLIELKAFYGK